MSAPRRIASVHDRDVTWGMVAGALMRYWSDFQSVHGFRCNENIAANAKCQRVLVLYPFFDGAFFFSPCPTPRARSQKRLLL